MKDSFISHRSMIKKKKHDIYLLTKQSFFESLYFVYQGILDAILGL